MLKKSILQVAAGHLRRGNKDKAMIFITAGMRLYLRAEKEKADELGYDQLGKMIEDVADGLIHV